MRRSLHALSLVALALAPALAVAAPPPQVEGVTALPKSDQSIEIRWIDTSTIEKRFRVEIAVGEAGSVEAALLRPTETFQTVKRPKANAEKALIKGLTPNTFYTFRVFAENNDGSSPPSNVVGAVTDFIGSPSTCNPSGNICLNGGRFKIEAQAFQGNTTVPTFGNVLTPNSAGIYFFAPDNLSAVVKVLNSCNDNNRYWVFASGLTNVEYGVSVTDTQAGRRRIYYNPQGAFQAVQDTSAFATCP
jgi:hypothetical protein